MKILRSDIYENLKMALATLRGNKLRSFLTVFGVVIGIITVMLIASIISGIDVSVKREVEELARFTSVNSIRVFTSDAGRAKNECVKS
jgi:putative ABC transport system permease protein